MAASVAAPPAQDRGPRSQILSPLVRKLAAEHQVDLAQVAGSGTGGRITKSDVMAFVAGRGAAPVATTPPPPPPAALQAAPMPAPEVVAGGEEVLPVSHIRKAIAQHMKMSSTSRRVRGTPSR
jgi:2-oxoglutarate dehydrogenase E2 component (dihydrolipoamide succinyltransferase)